MDLGHLDEDWVQAPVELDEARIRRAPDGRGVDSDPHEDDDLDFSFVSSGSVPPMHEEEDDGGEQFESFRSLLVKH